MAGPAAAAVAATYRFVITARRYRLESAAFTVDRNAPANAPAAGDPIAPFIPFTDGR